MKNWKTTLAGILAVLLTAAHAVWPQIFTAELTTAINTVLIAIGLGYAKDHNVSGTPKQ